jgi:hypothetical protein
VPFIINEDQALKEHLQGLTVSDQNDNARPVKVYYRLPESEERAVSYPFLTLDLLDIEEEPDRAHRGRITPQYLPEGYTTPPAGMGDYKTEFPIPVSLLYQITSHTRSAWHDRQLTAQLIGNKLPIRFGQLFVPADETVRRMDLVDFQAADSLDRNNKRVFRKAITVAVSAELFLEELETAQTVDSVGITVYHQLEPFIIEQEPVP